MIYSHLNWCGKWWQTCVLCILMVACQDHFHHHPAKLYLTIHLNDIEHKWLTDGQLTLTLVTAQQQVIDLNQAEWLIQDEDIYTQISGPWRPPFRLVLSLEHPAFNDEFAVQSSHFETTIKAAPELDYLKHLILYDVTQLPQVHFYLQPLTFLKADQQDTQSDVFWSELVGLDQGLWWSISSPSMGNEIHDKTEQNLGHVRQLISEIWKELSMESTWGQSLFPAHIDEQLKPWLMIKRLSGQTDSQIQDHSAQWGELFYEALIKKLSGETLSYTLAQILSHISCVPWPLITWQMSHKFSECMQQFSGLYIEQPKLDLDDPLIDQHAVLSSRVISLDGSAINHSYMHSKDAWGRSRFNDEIVLDIQRQDALFMGEGRYPTHYLRLRLPHHLTNRPATVLNIQATNEKGAEYEQEWTVNLSRPMTTEVFGFASLLDPIYQGSYRAKPLAEQLHSPQYPTEWTGGLSEEGDFKIQIHGYLGPLWVEVRGVDDHYLTLITSTSKPTHAEAWSHHHLMTRLAIWLSPWSTLNTWLNLELYDGEDINDIMQNYKVFDREHAWLSGWQSVTELSTKWLVDQAEILVDLQKAHQRERRCLSRSVQISERNSVDLDRPWIFTEPPLDQYLDTLSSVSVLDRLRSSIDLWIEWLLAGCLLEQLEDTSMSDFSPFSRLALYEAFQGNGTISEQINHLGIEVGLYSGVWYESAGTWWLSSPLNLEVYFAASRGLMTLAMSSEALDLEHIHSSVLLEPRRLAFCPWNILENGRADDRWTWRAGQWSSLSVLDLEELYEDELVGQVLGWTWTAEQKLALPLPCQLSITLDDISSRSDHIQFKIRSRIWKESTEIGLSEVIAKNVKLKVKQHFSELSYVLNHPQWSAFEDEQNHWVTDQINTRTQVMVEVFSEQAVVCQFSEQWTDLVYPSRVGDLEMSTPNTETLLEGSTLSHNMALSIEHIIPLEWGEVISRRARDQGGSIFSDQFKGNRLFQATIEMNHSVEGSAFLYLRCEDALGYTSISKSTWTVDSEPPQIIEAKLIGVNEPILLADRVHILPTITRGDRIREVNLQESIEERMRWGRWVNHWQVCQDDCPNTELQTLMLNIIAQDAVWKPQQLRVSLDAHFYTLDHVGNYLNETLQRSMIGHLNNDGLWQVNVYELLYQTGWGALPPSNGKSVFIDLNISVSDPLGHETQLAVPLELVPIAPMVNIRFQPSNDSLHRLVSQGDLSESLDGSFGQLHLYNPHNIPVFVSIPIPNVLLNTEITSRDSGVVLETSRLLDSCLYTSSYQAIADLRMIDHQLESDLSISGQCVSLIPTSQVEPQLRFNGEAWNQDSPVSTLSFTLLPNEERLIELPHFRPRLPLTLSELITDPNISATMEYPSPFQRRLFPELSIFQGVEQCQNCAPSYFLGNRIISLESYGYELEVDDMLRQQLHHIELYYDVEMMIKPWSLMISRFAEDEHTLIYSLHIPTQGEYFSP